LIEGVQKQSAEEIVRTQGRRSNLTLKKIEYWGTSLFEPLQNSIMTVIQRRVQWTGYVACMGVVRIAYKFIV
jgi:hypothetical protein